MSIGFGSLYDGEWRRDLCIWYGTTCEDIEIVYTGLRPGEKLYEELLYNEENSTPTLNPKIFKGISLKQDYDKIKPALQQLVEVAQTDNKKETVYQLKQIVPEFKNEIQYNV